jgi:predicted dehydrogenase
MSMRFAVVGTGYWARHTHACALATHPGVDLVGVWGRSPAKALELAEIFDIRAYENVDDLFEDVDAVAFAVPPDVQADLAVRAAQRGCHLLLDKPIAFTSEAADRLVEAVDAAGVRSLVFFTRHFVENQAAWLRDVRQEPDWFSGAVRMYGSIFEPGNPFGESAWRRERGALWDIGPHALSILIPALGRVTGVVGVRGRGDLVTVALQHESGATSTMSLSLTAPPGALGEQIELFGSRRSTVLPEASLPAIDAMLACISQLLVESSGSWSHPCDVHFGREVTAVLQAADSFLRDRDDLTLPVSADPPNPS